MRFGALTRLIESREQLAGLIQAVLEHRTNPDYYLVLADFLEEQGDPLGDLLRIAIQSHNMSADQQRNLLAPLLQHQRAAGLGEDVGVYHHESTIWWNEPVERDGKEVGHMARKIHIPFHQAYTSHRGLGDVKSIADLPYRIQRAIVLLLAKTILMEPGSTLHRWLQHTPDQYTDFHSRIAFYFSRNLLFTLDVLTDRVPTDGQWRPQQIRAISRTLDEIDQFINTHPNMVQSGDLDDWLERFARQQRERNRRLAPSLVERMRTIFAKIGVEL